MQQETETARRVPEGSSASTSAELERIDAVAAAITCPKVFSPEMLGQGKAKGGNKEHRQRRYDAFERVRRLGNLTEDQHGH